MSGHLKAPPLYYNIIIHTGNRQDKNSIEYQVKKEKEKKYNFRVASCKLQDAF